MNDIQYTGNKEERHISEHYVKPPDLKLTHMNKFIRNHSIFRLTAACAITKLVENLSRILTITKYFTLEER
jgi:hypothetical protein